MRRIFGNVLWLPAALLLVLGVVGASKVTHASRPLTTDAVTAYQAPDTHRVAITVSSAGDFTYSLNPIRAKRNDVIEWSSDSGNWSIQVAGLRDEQTGTLRQGRTPFAQNQRAARANRRAANRLAVAGDAVFGTYKYNVAVEVGGNVFIDDPEIIIGGGG